MAEDTTTPKADRAKPQPRGFVLELGAAAEVAEALKLGKFAEIETKAELETRFADWIAVQPVDLVAGFLAHLKRLAQERLDGMGPATPKPVKADPPGSLANVLLTPDGGIPIAGTKE